MRQIQGWDYETSKALSMPSKRARKMIQEHRDKPGCWTVRQAGDTMFFQKRVVNGVLMPILLMELHDF